MIIFVKIFNLIIATITYSIILTFKIFFKFKINLIDSERIGHFLAGSYSAYLNKSNIFQINVIYKEVCNKFLLKKFKKKIFYFDNFFSIYIYKAYKIDKKIFKINNFNIEFPTYKPKNNLKLIKNIINFDNLEKKQINSALKELGITKKFVCLHVRDEKYLQTTFKKKDYSYHSYRNANINKYKILINYLISKNYQIVRMGRIVKNKLKLKNKNFVDYPFSKNKSDMLDVYFGCKCEFVIGTGSGWEMVPTLFNKDNYVTNSVDFGYVDYNKKHYLLFKKFVYQNSKIKKKLQLEEIIEKNYHKINRAKLFKEKGIILKENNPKELLKGLKEFMRTRKKQNGHKSKLNQKFFKILEKKEDLSKYKPLKTRILEANLN